jgi:hypothetical protein
MTAKPNPNAAPEPISLFELERRQRSNPEHRGQYGGEDPGKTIDEAFPHLPPSSPWSSDPVPPEELIDRTEDSDFSKGE